MLRWRDMNFIFPQEAIDFLRGCQYDPKAQVSYEMIAGGLLWSDEKYIDFMLLCKTKTCLIYGVPFAFRSSLVRGQPYQIYRYAWEELRLHALNGSAFGQSATTPSPDLQEFLRRSEESF